MPPGPKSPVPIQLLIKDTHQKNGVIQIYMFFYSTRIIQCLWAYHLLAGVQFYVKFQAWKSLWTAASGTNFNFQVLEKKTRKFEADASGESSTCWVCTHQNETCTIGIGRRAQFPINFEINDAWLCVILMVLPLMCCDHTNWKDYLRVDGWRKKLCDEMFGFDLMSMQCSLLWPFWVASFIKGRVKQACFNLYGCDTINNDTTLAGWTNSNIYMNMSFLNFLWRRDVVDN